LGVKRRNAGLLSGEVDAMAAPLTGALKLAKAGKFRILASPSAKRNPVIPDVPTMKELGYEAEIALFRGLSVPKGTPAAVKAKITDAMMKAARSPAFMKLAKQKGFTVQPMDSAQFDGYLAVMNKKVQAIMKNAGLYQSKRKK
jgi:tripartite-type tricarboxylate transporter receptor subunit TctC